MADGEELVLGIFMSCSGILLSAIICTHLAAQSKRDADAPSAVDWGSLACNFVACVFVCLAYEASKLSPHAIRNNLLVLKFVSSFCGSISCFSAAISHMMVRRCGWEVFVCARCALTWLFLLLLVTTAALACGRPARRVLEPLAAPHRRAALRAIPEQAREHQVMDAT